MIIKPPDDTGRGHQEAGPEPNDSIPETDDCDPDIVRGTKPGLAPHEKYARPVIAGRLRRRGGGRSAQSTKK